MAEKHRPSEQTTELLELNHEDWYFIASLKFRDTKINQYALAKAAGLIDEQQGPFMGHRHWREIFNTVSTMKVPTKKGDPKQQLLEEISRSAYTASLRNFTLNDYYAEEDRTKINIHHTRDGEVDETVDIVWSDETCSWQRAKEIWVIDMLPRGSGGDIMPSVKDHKEHTEPATSEDEKKILNSWMLTKNVVPYPIGTSPQELVRIAKEKITAGILNGKLRVRLGEDAKYYKSIGGWEKPIPQAN